MRNVITNSDIPLIPDTARFKSPGVSFIIYRSPVFALIFLVARDIYDKYYK